MKKIILAAASVLAASGSIAPADEIGWSSQNGNVPIQATRSDGIDFTPTTSTGLMGHYTAAENSPWKRFGDGELSSASNTGNLGIDFQPTGSVGSTNRIDDTVRSDNPWERFGDAAPVWQVLD